MSSAIAAVRAEALDRTVTLMREHVADAAPDTRLSTELSRCRVMLVADRANASSRHGQVAIVTAALLCARMGVEVIVAADDVQLVGVHPPLTTARLLEALTEIGADLIPGSTIHVAGEPSRLSPDICVLVGNTPMVDALRADVVIRMCGDDWSGGLLPVSEAGTSWVSARAPFGALAAAALAAAEAYKLVMRRLREAVRVPVGVFDSTFAPSARANVRLAPSGTPCPSALGDVDFISGGAITHAALYALARIDNVTANARVMEPQTYDLTNVNRYALMRRSDVGHGKALHLSRLGLAGIEIEPIPQRYDDALQRGLGALKESVLVGVDHIPSRWLAQASSAGWLGVAATERYETVVSLHYGNAPCAACLHHSDGGIDPRAPTVSFVSFWAGLWLGALFVRHLAGERPPLSEQLVRTVMLRSDSPYAISIGPVQRRPDCRLSCGQRRARDEQA